MVAYVASDYNTGWMQGDIKLATLSDTDDTDVSGGNEITNGDAWSGASSSQSSTAPTGWTGEGGATWATQSGGDGSYIRLYNENNGGAGPNSYMHQTITTVVGKKYTISATQYHHATITVYLSVGTGAGVGNLLNIQYNSSSSDTPKELQGTFTATGTTTYINLGVVTGTHNYSVGWDNIVVTESEQDRSVNANGLQVFGTVPKTPVATGADLVAYGPFTSSNYLEQPYNSDLDFGTGDFMYSMWIYRNSLPTSSYERWFGTASESDDERIDIFSNANTDNIAFYSRDNAVVNGDVRITGIGIGVWHCFHFTRQANVYKIYHNGELKGTNVGSSTLANYQGANGNRRTHIGASEHWDTGRAVLDGKIALAKISGTVPSPEQIKKMYNDEKHLFQENAKATLYGTSDAVTALAYDDATELLHVGTSAGRSVFQGLTRIDNTTDAVGAAISASNGLVAED
jgi:hypothetical protein